MPGSNHRKTAETRQIERHLDVARQRLRGRAPREISRVLDGPAERIGCRLQETLRVVGQHQRAARRSLPAQGGGPLRGLHAHTGRAGGGAVRLERLGADHAGRVAVVEPEFAAPRAKVFAAFADHERFGRIMGGKFKRIVVLLARAAGRAALLGPGAWRVQQGRVGLERIERLAALDLLERSTELRDRLALGTDIPNWFSYAAVVKELRRSHPRWFGITLSFVVQPTNAHTLVDFAKLADACPNLIGYKDGVGDIEHFVSVRRRPSRI